MQIKRLSLENSAWIFFVLSVFVMGFAYGFLSHRENIFPQSLLHEAALAGRALVELETEFDGATMPASFKSFDDAVDSGPNFHLLGSQAPTSDEDWVFVVGGPYEYLEKCPTFGCMAWVIDQTGTVIHTWEVDLESLWSDADHVKGITSHEHFKPTHVELLADGGIVAVFWNAYAFPNGAGIAKFDIDGNLVWHRKDNSHHWLTMDPKGRIYVPALRVVKTPLELGETPIELECDDVNIAVDFIQVLDGNGEVVEEIPLFDILIEKGYAGLIERTELPCDPLHLNFVQYVDTATASRLDNVEAGDLLVSMRNTNAVALLDPKEREIKWLTNGLTVKQHSPRFLPDGSVVVFDNLGGDGSLGGSRITRHQIYGYGVETLFPVGPLPNDRLFKSVYAGHIEVHPEGKTALVSATEDGTIWHIDLVSGEVLWIYEKVFPTENYPHDAAEPGPYVRVEAFGTSFIDKAEFTAALAKTPKE